MDPRVDRLAQILVEYSCEVKPGDHVAIYASNDAEPLVRAVYRRILRAGGIPYALMGYGVYFSYGGFDDIFFKEASDEQLQHVFRTDQLVLREFQAMIAIRSQTNTRLLSGIDAKRQQLRNQAYAELHKAYLARGASRELKWVVTLFPNDAQAQEAEMDRQSYEDFVYAACHADQEEAVATWGEVDRQQARLVDWLKGKKQVEVKGPTVDLRLSIEGRTFNNANGKFNMPDGEVYTGPVEDSVEGWIRFTYPAVRYGAEVEGVELTFEGGRVINSAATKNHEFLEKMLDTDEGSRRLGEFAIGTNHQIDRFTKNILFDEKLGGTIHLAIGSGYPETGSVNESGIHWDMICDMGPDGEIVVDGDLFYRGGQFLID